MSDNPNANYFKPSLGSLTGFDRVDLPAGNPDITQTGWSISELQDFLRNAEHLNFPPEEWVLQVSEMIYKHLNDFDNPHQVTLAQVVENFVNEVLGNIVTGTPPDLPPFFAYDAVGTLPLGIVFPASYSTINAYRVTEGGAFVDDTGEEIVQGTDQIQGVVGLPLFSSFTNCVPANWASTPGIAINTQIEQVDDASLKYPESFYQVSETSNVGAFGIVIPATETAGTFYSATFFFRPVEDTGFLIIGQASDIANVMTVDLSDASFTCASSVVNGAVVVYPDGIWRISFSFKATSPVADRGISLKHRNREDISSNRIGTPGRDLFQLACPMVTTSTVNHPMPVDRTKAVVTSPFVIDMSRVPTPATMANLLVSMKLNLYPALPSAPIPGDTLFRFGALSITRDQTKVYVNVNGTRYFTSDILEGHNAFTLSYSRSTLIFKDLAHDRQEVTGVFLPLSTMSVSAGPCGGYLRQLTLYAQQDNTNCVEFLTNG